MVKKKTLCSESQASSSGAAPLRPPKEDAPPWLPDLRNNGAIRYKIDGFVKKNHREDAGGNQTEERIISRQNPV